MAFAVLIFSIRSMDRSDEWTTEEKLFTTGLNVCPNNAKVNKMKVELRHCMYVG